MSSKTTIPQNHPTMTATRGGSPEWEPALRALEQRHTQAMAALEQTHSDRLAQMEERLAAAEQAAGDLAGQIKELR